MLSPRNPQTNTEFCQHCNVMESHAFRCSLGTAVRRLIARQGMLSRAGGLLRGGALRAIRPDDGWAAEAVPVAWDNTAFALCESFLSVRLSANVRAMFCVNVKMALESQNIKRACVHTHRIKEN